MCIKVILPDLVHVVQGIPGESFPYMYVFQRLLNTRTEVLEVLFFLECGTTTGYKRCMSDKRGVIIIIVGQILGLVESETDLVTLCLDTEKEFLRLLHSI